MGTGNRTTDRDRILQYWTLLELFSPKSVPRPTRRATRPSDKQVVSWRPGQPLPWTTLAPPPQRGKTQKSWQHTIYLGVYELEDTFQLLHRAFGEDRDAYDARRSGQSASAAVVLDHRGVLAVESSVLASAPWAIAQLEAGSPSRSPEWATDFPEAARAFPEMVDELEGARRDAYGADKPLPHDEESLLVLLQVAHRAAGIQEIPELASTRILIESTVRDDAQPTDSDFLNSFFLEDLARVQKDIRRGEVPAALSQYLTPAQELLRGDRIDVMTAPRIVDAEAGIDRLPRGRWPSNPGHSLALRQQFAVNRALGELAETAGLMGVNGPPGTGKTTMLRDILAGNLVERARRLSRLSRPEDAFTTTTHTWKTDRFTRKVRQLRPELTGFEMVVASANNAAVENVSAEIPARDAIAEAWRESADYFSDIATATLGDAIPPREDDLPRAWGLVAAKLGNKSNRGSFFSSFWFDHKPRRTGTSSPEAMPGMQTLLKNWESGATPHRGWREARDEFQAEAARVDELIRRRHQAQARLDDLPGTVRALQEQHQRERLHLDDLAAARHARDEHTGAVEHAEAELADASATWDRHVATRPGWLETLLTWGRATRTWREKVGDAEERRQAADGALAQARALAQRLENQHHTLEEYTVSAAADRRRAEDTLQALRTRLAEDAASFGSGYPGEAWTGNHRELHAPWLDAQLDSARSSLFLAAMRLHEDFLAHTAGDMRKGLNAAMDVLTGKGPRNLTPQQALAAWQTFFLVVPMVSTTFASYARMFSGLGRESLGWLLIDEAGQASPQYAAGAIWRSRRVIAVGDPLQLQPVVTMPHKAQRDIAQAFGVGGTWIPPQASVQTLADRVSRMGTTLRIGEDDVWVSAPLTVHRRCDNPMFSVCNEIAYNGIMVSGVHRALDDPHRPDLFDAPDGPRIAPSRWLDEPAPAEGTHLQENQVARMLREIEQLREGGVDPSAIIAVSPFRAVADRLGSLARDFPDLTAGTIHRAQGKEAEVVFLVLGGDPAAPGAKSWASESVNLVNVAASRAKRRLYVIGDRRQWSKYPYFRELSAALGGHDVPHG